jgi:hypothetical protein
LQLEQPILTETQQTLQQVQLPQQQQTILCNRPSTLLEHSRCQQESLELLCLELMVAVLVAAVEAQVLTLVMAHLLVAVAVAVLVELYGELTHSSQIQELTTQ